MPQPKPDSAEIARLYQLAQALQHQERLDEAKQHYLTILRLDPNHSDALHALGNIDAKTGALDDGARLIRKAFAINPMQAAFAVSLGNILRAQGKLAEAAAVYEQAITLQPGLANAHNNLGMVFQQQGNLEQAVKCYFKALDHDPENANAYNNLGRALNNRQRLDEAADAFRQAIAIAPDFAEAHNNLGHVFRSKGELGQAETCFRNAIEVKPGLHTAHFNLGTVLMLTRRPSEAADSFSEATRLDPVNVDARLNEGIALHTAGSLVQAVESYQKVIELDASHSEAWLALGLAHNELRNSDAALSALGRAIETDPESVRPYSELAALHEDLNQLEDAMAVAKKGFAIDPGDPRINLEMAKLERRNGDIVTAIARLEKFDIAAMDDRIGQQFCYELGLEKDRVGEHDRAFELFTEANRRGLSNERLQNVDSKRFLDKIDSLARLFSESDVTGWPKTKPLRDDQTPVFLFGFPRSGTTLTDLLLDGHPDIQTLEEKPTINRVEEALGAMPGGYPAALAKLTQSDIDALREVYFSEVDRHADRDAGGIIVDKLPIRTVHAGLIWRLFPNAKVLFSARHPCDVCLSCFMQQFNSNDAFANFFNLDDTVNIYDKVMALWQLYVSRLRLNVHLLRYEDLVDDLEGETRRLLRFLGAKWVPEVIEFNRTAAGRGRIATNSYHQVTEPLYQRAKGRWHAYADRFAPYMSTLEPHIRYFGYHD